MILAFCCIYLLSCFIFFYKMFLQCCKTNGRGKRFYDRELPLLTWRTMMVCPFSLRWWSQLWCSLLLLFLTSLDVKNTKKIAWKSTSRFATLCVLEKPISWYSFYIYIGNSVERHFFHVKERVRVRVKPNMLIKLDFKYGSKYFNSRLCRLCLVKKGTFVFKRNISYIVFTCSLIHWMIECFSSTSFSTFASTFSLSNTPY